MIKSQTELNSYSNYKFYLPSQYINSNYVYKASSGFIQIITNNNCTGSNSSRYCSCYSYYYDTGLITNSYQCQNYITNNTSTIPYTSFSSDINTSSFIKQNYFYDKFIMFGIIIIALLFFISLRKGYRYI